ncbi:MAG: hypothetical protein AAB497_00380 [Patescibacteria group bacterium]
MNKQDLQKVLWDISVESIDTLSTDFVIQRILSYGGLILLVKAIREYGNAKVTQVFETMKPTSIPARKYHYLKNFLLS